MKEFMIFALLIVLSPGDAKKVCILYEQKPVPTSISVSDQASVTINEKSSDTQDDILITIGDLPDITSEALAETPESTTEVTTSYVTQWQSTNTCSLEGITLFDDQNDLLRKMCTIKPGSTSLYVVTVQNSVVKSDLSLATLCSEGAKGLLSWISWQDFIEKVKPFLFADELPPLVVRNLSIGGPSDSQVDPVTEVLIEMLPISYRLVDVSQSAWNNNTFIKTVSLGNMELENSNDTTEHIEGALSYSFLIQTNITFLSSYPISGLFVQMPNDTSGRRNFHVGSGISYIFNNTFSVERSVPAFKKEVVSLKGTFGLREYDIQGTMISIFGVNPDGTTIEESHSISARVVSSETFDIKDTYFLEDYTTITTEESKSTTYEELPIAIPHKNGPVYPGFKKFFYVAVFLVLTTFIVAFVDIIRKIRQDRVAKRQGRRAYQKIAPKF